MGKGDIGERVVWIIGAVIFFSIAIFIIFKIFPNLMTSIFMALGIVKPSNIDNAILCSIHRCVDGCMSMKVQEITWKEEGKDKPVTCQEFCQDLPGDAYTRSLFGFGDIEPQLKVCGSKYPVNITLKAPEKITKGHLLLGSTSVSDVRCVLSTTATGPDLWDIFKGIIGTLTWQQLVNLWALLTGGTVSENLLMVDTGLIKSEGSKEDCVAAGTSFVISHDSLTELLVPKSGTETIYIMTDFKAFGPVNTVLTLVRKG
jgi:hypothetical protein